MSHWTDGLTHCQHCKAWYRRSKFWQQGYEHRSSPTTKGDWVCGGAIPENVCPRCRVPENTSVRRIGGGVM